MATSISCCLLAVLLTIGAAQSDPYDFCNWAQFRAAVVRDQIWIDGGELWTSGRVELSASSLYSLNFSSPFDTTVTNLTALFQNTSKISFPANTDPGYVGGTMFANDYEFNLYGGLAMQTDAFTALNLSTTVLGFELYNNTPGRTWWEPFTPFEDSTSAAGMTTYVTDGAGVNVPSENLGFYFSGMQNPTGGSIGYNLEQATMAAGSLIEVDMTTPSEGIWTNHTLDASITPRANAQLTWVPVSTKGILVAVGGVINPEDVFDSALSNQQQQESRRISPGFMKSIPVYDIATNVWYLQPATGKDGYPPQLSGFCSVLAVSNDSSSFELYIYGGYDGVLATDTPSDDVWILSMPAFTWIKAYSGVASHGRSSHYCAKPYPNTMFVIGGVHISYENCVDGLIQVFNLNTLQFENVYNPAMSNYSYLVPDKVSSVIGGDSMGGATKTADWVSPNLGALFNLPYPTPITTWYPYQPSLPPSVPGPSPHWLVPVIAVVIACFVITLIGLAVWYCIRRNRNKKRASGDEYEISSLPSDAHAGTRRWLGNVIRGMPDAAMLHGVPKSEPSVTTTEVDGDHNHVAVAYEVSGNSRVVSSSSPNNRLSNNNSVAGSSGHQRMPSERHDSSELGDTRQAYEMYTSRSATELPAQYHDPYHPRSIDHAMDAGYAHHPPGAGISRFSNPGTSPELAASEDLNPVDVSPSLGGSHHPYSDPNSPNAQLSPEVELPPDNFATRGSSEHRPAHARNISTMSSLPSPTRAADPEPLAGDVHPTQTFSQYQPDFNPEYVQDDPEGSTRVQRANFNAGFGPDGQARSSSVLTRKPVGKAIYVNPQLLSRPESGEAEYFVPYDGQ